MRSHADGIPAGAASDHLPDGTPVEGRLPDWTLEACQLRWLDDALTPISRFEAVCRLGLGKALGLRRRAMAAVSLLVGGRPEPYGGWFRWTEADDGTSAAGAPRQRGGGIAAGDLVEVRPLDEVRATLDERGKHDGLMFLRPMEQYCGRRFRVLKQVRRILDEHDHVMRKVRSTVVLEGSICHGQGIRGREGCDRSCFFFWKEAWLTKIEE
jgi:hypothetical protein